MSGVVEAAVARKRWKILAGALLRGAADDARDVSVRRFTSFDLISPPRSDDGGGWREYSTSDRSYSIKIRTLSDSLSAADLIGFNNTGNVCIWPSEETLSIFIVSNLERFDGKSVLELGGGMSCMAGLILAKYGTPRRVDVTDGNSKSVENVETVLKMNRLDGKASCSVLQWQSTSDGDVSERYDVILVADCLFFDEAREDLIRTIRSYLSDSGVAYVMAPQRGDTLDRFVATSERFGFACRKQEKYDETVWRRHEELLEMNAHYDPSLHYPILLTLTKPI